MKLLVFAHFAESRAFLEREQYRAISLPFNGLWRSKDHFILIGGEGDESAARAAYVLGKFPIEAFYNLGVAASLTDKMEKESIHSIRTCYRCRGESTVAFHSFSSADPSADKDLITSDLRVTSPEQANFLESFAPLADREAHPLAHIAQRTGIPFYAFKVVSDHPSNGAAPCQDVRQQSQRYSRLLFDFYHDHQTPIRKPTAPDPVPEGFYFSATMKRRYQTLKDSLPTDRLDKILHRLRKAPLSPKERGKALLQRLENLSLPPKTEKALEQIFAPLQGPHRRINWGNALESAKFQLQTSIHSPQDIEDLIADLQAFDYTRLQELFDSHV